MLNYIPYLVLLQDRTLSEFYSHMRNLWLYDARKNYFTV